MTDKIAKADQFMTKADLKQFTQYAVQETATAITKATGSSIAGMSHNEAEMWAKTCVSAQLYPKKDKGTLTPNELISRALVKGVAGQKYGLDFFESQTAFHVLHDGSLRPDYTLRLWQIEASPNYRFRFSDDGETCTGIISKLQEGKWVDMDPVSFSMEDAIQANLVKRDKDGKLSGNKTPWIEHPGVMRLTKVIHRCFKYYCGGLMLPQDKVFQASFDGDGVEEVFEDADPFAIEEAPVEETTPVQAFYELASVKFETEDGGRDEAQLDAFLAGRDPDDPDQLDALMKELREL